ncbi:hypothetical protein NY547_01405 [Cnuibacter physcomitrellae]|uniref:hypothetical protein n=1 Tax=Cnuibacter physcomitrellae TaxID=1619308 RepID=UPI00217597C3|nr:hypothetical protein [Cnuibacter physcomitrellae]MCS5495897.1 hypothetical protein [Cnuibacter physcomitrellae]
MTSDGRFPPITTTSTPKPSNLPAMAQGRRDSVLNITHTRVAALSPDAHHGIRATPALFREVDRIP